MLAGNCNRECSESPMRVHHLKKKAFDFMNKNSKVKISPEEFMPLDILDDERC
jgi:hypothetical protein